MASTRRRAHGRVESARDRGDIVLGWLVRVVALLAVVGVMAFDALSVGSSRLSIDDQATTAARAAADSWAASHDMQGAFDTAWRSATESDSTNDVDVKSFSIDAAGVAHVTLRREAPTFVMRLIPPLRHLAVVRAVGDSQPSAT